MASKASSSRAQRSVPARHLHSSLSTVTPSTYVPPACPGATPPFKRPTVTGKSKRSKVTDRPAIVENGGRVQNHTKSCEKVWLSRSGLLFSGNAQTEIAPICGDFAVRHKPSSVHPCRVELACRHCAGPRRWTPNKKRRMSAHTREAQLAARMILQNPAIRAKVLLRLKPGLVFHLTRTLDPVAEI